MDPGQLRSELRPLEPGSWVVIDEIQRLPPLLNEVHRAIEEFGLRFVLTGSSARKLRRGGVNLLGGRAVTRYLHPFLPSELGPNFDLNSALRHGTIPVICGAPDPEDSLRGYVQTYLRQEIRAEALVRNLPAFARFLPVAGLFHAQVLNITAVARDAQVSRTTVQSFVGILEDTLTAFRLPAFTPRLRVREKKHPKLYIADPGLARAMAARRGEPGPEERGALFEGWLASLLRAHRDYDQLCDEISYWAPSTASQTEVDFVLRRGDEYLAIEAKLATRLRPQHFKGLRAMGELAGLRGRILVYLGERVLRTEEGIDVLPLPVFLERMDTGEIWPRIGSPTNTPAVRRQPRSGTGAG